MCKKPNTPNLRNHPFAAVKPTKELIIGLSCTMNASYGTYYKKCAYESNWLVTMAGYKLRALLHKRFKFVIGNKMASS